MLIEPSQVTFEQRQLQFDLGVACGDRRKTVDLGPGVTGADDQVVRLHGEQAGQKGDRPLPRHTPAGLQIRQRHSRDRDPLRQFLLGVPTLQSQRGDPLAQHRTGELRPGGTVGEIVAGLGIGGTAGR